MTEYTITASALVKRQAGEVIAWLATPDLMLKWIIGAESVETLDDLGIAVGATIRLEIRQRQYGNFFLGEIVELSDAKLVRRYRVAAMESGGLRVPAGLAEYERIVTYALGPSEAETLVTCTARTAIPGLSPAAAKGGAKAERASMRRSLSRLRVCAAGGQAGFASRISDSNYSGQAL